jgi:hypothetical protein
MKRNTCIDASDPTQVCIFGRGGYDVTHDYVTYSLCINARLLQCLSHYGRRQRPQRNIFQTSTEAAYCSADRTQHHDFTTHISLLPNATHRTI